MASMKALEPDQATVSEAVHQLTLGHSNTRILHRDGRIGFGTNYFDLVERFGGIRNELTKNFFVDVEGVDDQAHQLLNVGMERESLLHGFHRTSNDEEMNWAEELNQKQLERRLLSRDHDN